MNFRVQWWMTIVCSVLATVSVGTKAFAGCESLFEYGIYDIDEKTSDGDRTVSFRQWVCQRKFGTKADAARFIAATDTPAEALPLKTGPKDALTDFKDSYAAFCADTDINSPGNQELSRTLGKTNGKMLDRFNACLSSDGLHAWVRQMKEPGSFRLNFLHKAADSSSKPATVVTITRFNVLCENLRLPFELAGAEKSFSCTRIDPTNQSSLWVLASEPVVEGANYWVGKTTYTPTGDAPTLP